MHCICLGIVKTRFQSMVTEKGSTFYVGDQTRTLNDRLSSIKPPGRKIGRLPRETSELQHWKATEFKNWLIHYSLVVLHGILDHRYFLHWSLLVSSIGILTKDHISPGDLTLADEMLKDFCLLYPIFYGAYSCSMNFHLVRHLAYYVFRRGPLWAYSCFAFESLNAYIKGLVHGTHHAIDQITCALGLYYGLPGYAKKLSEMRNVPKKAKTLLLSLLSIKKDKKSKIVKIDAGFLSSRVSGDGTISQDVINSFKSYVEKVHSITDVFLKDLHAYRKFDSANGYQVTSAPEDKYMKTDSSIIRYVKEITGEKCFGRVAMFLLFENQAYAIVHPFKKINKKRLHGKFNKDCEKTGNKEVDEFLDKYDQRNIITHYELVEPRLGHATVVPVKNIEDICILMDFLEDFWVISSFPNSVEPN